MSIQALCPSRLIVCALIGLTASSTMAVPDHLTYDIVLGQVRTNLGGPNSPDEMGLSRPLAIAIDTSHSPNHVYVADASNARVLGWRDIARFKTGAPPDLILGQPDKYTIQSFRRDSQAISFPTGLTVDRQGTLWVSDSHNGRVVGFLWPFDPGQKPSDNITADLLIGQSFFGLGYHLNGCNGGLLFGSPTDLPATNRTVCNPAGLATDPGGNLYVADAGNSRVLRFRAPIPARGAAADLLFGQDQFTTFSGACNRRGTELSARTLCRPSAVLFHQDGATGRLYVSDTANARVLVYDDPERNRVASRVFGQPDMVTNSSSRLAGRFRSSNGIALARNGVLWIADSGNHRVPGYVPPFMGTAGFIPSHVLGQASIGDFTPNRALEDQPIPAPTAATLSVPDTPIFDGQDQLLLSEAGNNRVLVFDTPSGLGPNAAAVVGQSGFSRRNPNRTKARGLFVPSAVALDRSDVSSGGPIHVYVADMGNSRVLGWRDLAMLKNGSPADLVIGQPSMEEEICNQGKSPSEKTLCFPRGVVADPQGDLWVSDTWNHRVLRFPKPFAKAENQPSANLVLGQPDFISRKYNRADNLTPTAGSLFTPGGLAVSDQGVLFVADRDNHRVVGFRAPFSSGMEASLVLIGPVMGQPFEQRGCPPDRRPAFVCTPAGLALDADGNLWVAEVDNHRVALYRTAGQAGPSLDTTPLAILGQPSATENRANQGLPQPSAQSLFTPAGVSVEVRSDAQGRKTAQAIVVADLANSRVLIYDPVTTGFAPAARQVIGQEGKFDQRLFNLEQIPTGITTGREKGLAVPVAVGATAEGIMIVEGGIASLTSYRDSPVEPAGLFRLDGNNRVLIIKGPAYPVPPQPPPADLGQPGTGADMGPAAAEPGGCGCVMGAPPPSGTWSLCWALVLMFVARRRWKEATHRPLQGDLDGRGQPPEA